ncbi:MAG: NAD(P)-dependent alcohol dehydrogenase [Nitriliruptorales bacterium]
MKAVRLHVYDERPVVEEVPEPAITGPLDVIVRLGGAGLCRTDLHIMQGMWKEDIGVDVLPLTLGHENAGWVHEAGDGVTHVQVGDPVICHPQMTCGFCIPCRSGDDMHCRNSKFPGLNTDGGFAELLKTNARTVVKLPEGLEPKAVAAHADAGLTAYHAVKKAARMLDPGTHAVLIGAGGLGHIGIQCLKAMSPARIIVVDVSQEALKLCEDWGADHTVLADGSQVDAVKEITGGQGAEAVIDFVGEFGVIDYAKKMVGGHGSYFVVGYGDDVRIPAIQVIFNEIGFVGNLVGTYVELVELVTLAQQGLVRLETREYSLEAANDAISELENGQLRGRGIFVPQAT